MFLSTYEKQLDGKRRLLIPQEFRTADNGAEHGVFCFPSIDGAGCLEAGGDHLFAEYRGLIDGLPFGDPYRTALEAAFYAGQKPLAYDSGGRITLPESLVERAALSEDIVIAGLGSRFQIWAKDQWLVHRQAQAALAAQALRELGEARRKAALAARAAVPGGAA